jgi:hypothetical protein
MYRKEASVGKKVNQGSRVKATNFRHSMGKSCRRRKLRVVERLESPAVISRSRHFLTSTSR